MVTEPARIVLVAAKAENKETFTCTVQLADGARVPPTKETVGEPPVATTTLPLQVVTAFGLGDSTMPEGRLSTTPRLVNPTADERLVTVIVKREDSLAEASAVGEKVLLTLVAVNGIVLTDALTGVVVAICPSAEICPAGIVLVMVLPPVPSVLASNCKVQFPLGGITAPLKDTEAPPETALIVTGPAQVESAFAGLATTKPVGKGSVTLTPVSPVGPRFCTLMLTRETPLTRVTVGVENALLALNTGWTASAAVAADGGAITIGPRPELTVPETLDAGIVLVYAPGVTPRTLKETWQLPLAGTVNPLVENAVEPGTAVKLGAPPQVVLTLADAAI